MLLGGKFPPLEGARTYVSSRTGDDTFSPVREKVSKERTFVRIELPPMTPIKRYSYGAATDALSSGGIVALFA